MKRSSYWLLLIVGAALLLRTWNLSAQSLDIDEYTELQVSHETYAFAATKADSMPPLYPVLLKTWLAIFSGDMSGRWLSVFIGVATVWVVGALWSRNFGSALALTTAALLAISPLHIYYSQYVRSYGLLMLWTALAIGTLAQAVKSHRKSDWAFFVFSALGGLYTHYYFAIFLAVLSVAFAFWGYGWKWSRQWWVANLCVGVFALPLIGFVGKDLHFQKGLRESRPLDIPALGYTYVSMLTGYTIGPSKRDLQVFDRNEALASAAPVAVVIGMISLILGFVGMRHLRKRRLFSLFVLLAVAPVLLVGGLGILANVTFNPRFVVWSLLPILVLLAAGIIENHRSWIVRVALLLLVLVSGTALYNRQYVARHQNEDVRSLGNYLQQQAPSSAPVFVLSNYMQPLVAHYLPLEWEVLELPAVSVTDELQSTEELPQLAKLVLSKRLPEGGSYWLVYTRSFHGDPAGEIFASLSEQGPLKKAEAFAGIELYQGSVRSANCIFILTSNSVKLLVF